MNAEAKTVGDILRSGNQFLVPFFQRHYSWKHLHWKRLWEDLLTLQRQDKPQHFLGPLVCTPCAAAIGEMLAYQLIDGQQRLTTLTILLTALRDVADEHGHHNIREEIEEDYLINKRKTDLKRYKLIPRASDRQVLFNLIDRTPDETMSRRDGIVMAHRYFASAVRDFCNGKPPEVFSALLSSCTNRLSLVMVTIDGENPYDIFDSLNSTGLKLEQADLIRNFIFMRVPMQQQQAFNDQHWQPFEEFLDQFPLVNPTAMYRDYLMRDGEFSEKGDTYSDFKSQAERRQVSPADLVKELRRYAKLDLMIREPTTCIDPLLSVALQRLVLQKVTTAYPLVLNLLARVDSATLPKDEFLECLIDVQSFVLRRLVCGESGKSYSEWFCEVIPMLGDAPRSNLQKYLLRRGWPDDAAFVPAMREFPIYRRDSLKCRTILEALEESFGHKEQAALGKLTIEHVMPQTIGDDVNGRDWQEMIGPNWQDVQMRLLDTIGNLTLTGYNAPMSNKRFGLKVEKFKISHIELNAYFAKLTEWTPQEIIRRGEVLARAVASLRPRPTIEDVPWEPGMSDNPVGIEDEELGEWPALEYWSEFMKTLADLDPTIQPRGMDNRPRLKFNISTRDACEFHVFADAEEGCVGVTIRFRGRYAAADVRFLRQIKQTIESELREKLDWVDDEKPPQIVAYLDAARLDDRGDWKRQHAWLASTLTKFVSTFEPRLFKAMERPERKNLYRDLTDAFQKLDASDATDGITSFENWQVVKLSKWTTLYVQLSPQEHYAAVGLQFTGQRGEDAADGLLEHLGELQRSFEHPVEQESSGDCRYLTSYQFVDFSDRERWLEFFNWFRQAMQTYRMFHTAFVSPLLSKTPTAR